MSDIVTTLGLSDQNVDQNFIVATKDNISDLNFVYSDILSFYVKRNYSVISLNFAQSSSHYNHLLLKSGINIRQLREQQNFIIDGLSEIENLSRHTTQETMFRTLLADCHGDNCLKELYFSIKKYVEHLKSIEESKNYVIFIDEISVLLNLGVSLNAIEPFIQYCRSLCNPRDITPNILFLGTAYNEQDTKNVKLVNLLLHLGDIRIQIEGLKTGYSKDAHGKITINVKNKAECTSSHQKLLFKVTEKGAKLLTLGL